MRTVGHHTDLSPTDLAQFLACRHRTALDLAVARGLRTAPAWADPTLDLLRERGLRHEHAYVETLRAAGLGIVDLRV